MSLKSLLKEYLPEKKLSEVPRGFEVIGDIAIINIPSSLDDEKHIIARKLISHRKDVNVILRKVNKIHGEKRAGTFEVLLGDHTTTIHRENNCEFYVDITETYFSGKMAYERNRVAQTVNDGEDVLVLFCGVGPFLIPIKKNRTVNITGVDNNPSACQYLKKNIDLNNENAEVILADASQLNNLFKKGFDRIVMPTPYGQDHFLNHAETVLKPGGMVHFYTFKKDFEIIHFRKLLEEKGWMIDFYRNCGNVAPRVKRYVFDLKKR